MSTSVAGRAAFWRRASWGAGIALASLVAATDSVSAQPAFTLSVIPEVVTTGTRCEAIVTGARPSTQLKLFGSIGQGDATIGPWSSPCGDFSFRLLLAPDVKYLRGADGVADATGAATLRFRIPSRLPPRYNGVKVYFQVGGASTMPDGSGGCEVRTATTNVDCCTVRLGIG